MLRGTDRPGAAVEVVSYDPAWPSRFANWRDWLTTALGPAAIRVDHVGSTAVPGLSAKPIIDIQVSVANLDNELSYLPAAESTGVVVRMRESGHLFLWPAPTAGSMMLRLPGDRLKAHKICLI